MPAPPTLVPMSTRYVRPDWVRRVNAMGPAAGGPHHMVPLDADDLVDVATTAAGSDDFGDLGDGDWRGRLGSLVAAMDAADLHVVGRLMCREELLRALRTRLRMAQAWKANPRIADETVGAPVVITGPARSGTSILFELLATDVRLRAPIAHRALHPVEPDTAARTSMAECEQELWADVQPEFAAMHELRSDLPVECITLTLPSFAGSHWSMVVGDPGDWVPDPVADLAFHRAVLQTMQFGEPERTWVLKTPGHLIVLDELYRTYPDARVVLTHRDPARTMPSTVSTAAMVQWLRTDRVDLDAFAPLVGAVFTEALNDVADRFAGGRLPEHFGQVHFEQLLEDPAGAVAAAYGSIGLDPTEEHAASIRSYLADKPRGKFGVHRYTAAEWGFDARQLRAGLEPYMSTFGVEVPSDDV